MIFADEQHKEFYKKNKTLVGDDVYSDALIYLLGLTDDTRRHFNGLFDITSKEINIDGLNEAWQTGTSLKITRLAFNLFNGLKYDSHEELNDGKISKYFSVDDIFCCGYALYFFEAIKLRYPEYCTQRGIEG